MDEYVIEMAERMQAEALQRTLDNRVRYEGVSLSECEECGNDIPAARQEAIKGVRLCFDCQSVADRKAAGVKRG